MGPGAELGDSPAKSGTEPIEPERCAGWPSEDVRGDDPNCEKSTEVLNGLREGDGGGVHRPSKGFVWRGEGGESAGIEDLRGDGDSFSLIGAAAETADPGGSGRSDMESRGSNFCFFRPFRLPS